MKNASFSDDGSHLICSSSKSVIIFKTEDMTKVKEFETNGYINQMVFTNDGKIALVTNKNTLNFFNLEGEQEFEIKLKEEGISLDVNKESTLVYVGGAVNLTFS